MNESLIKEVISYAKKNELILMKEYLEKGGICNFYDQDGWTPLLWASARGHKEMVELLLSNNADIEMEHKISKALAIHFAGHSGSVETSKILLEKAPNHIDAVWDLNGHTILLQAVFYGHFELADYLVKKGADTSITTARGLGPMELATQFQNTKMIEILKPFDSSKEKKEEYYKTYLKRIAPYIPEKEKEIQKLSDELVLTIETGIKKAFVDSDSLKTTMDKIKELVEVEKADVNRLGGYLQQPPLIVTVTGNNGFPEVEAVKKLRYDIAEYLLNKGASPIIREKHPMGAQTIIRGAVFNHLDILKLCANFISPRELTDAINEIPVVNALTALHDTVLRATMASREKFEGYLQQAKWFMDNGGKSDIEDFAGVTQKDIAKNCKDEYVRNKLLEVL